MPTGPLAELESAGDSNRTDRSASHWAIMNVVATKPVLNHRSSHRMNLYNFYTPSAVEDMFGGRRGRCCRDQFRVQGVGEALMACFAPW